MTPPSLPLLGILRMVVAGLCFIAMTAGVKHAAQALPAAEAAFLRDRSGLVCIAPFAPALLARRMPRRELCLFAARGVLHAVAVILWFFAMTRIPLAEVTAMTYLSPVYVTLGAAAFLGERLSLPRVCAIAAALVGVAIILRPGFKAVDPGHLAMLGVGVLFGVSYLLGKRLADLNTAPMVVTMLSVTVTLGLAPLAAAVWTPPSGTEAAWMLLVAGFATAGHYAMTLAFAAAPVSVTQRATVLQMVWAVLLGWALFGEPPDAAVVVGASVIIAAVGVIAVREARRRRVVTPGPFATKFKAVNRMLTSRLVVGRIIGDGGACPGSSSSPSSSASRLGRRS